MVIRAFTGFSILSRVPKGYLCRLILTLFFFAIPAFPQTVAPQLILDPVNIRQDGVVNFSPLFLGTESRTDFSGQQFSVGQTDDQAFRLCLDLNSIQQIRFNAFTFTAYVVNVKTTNEAFKFQVTGNPTGSFQDTSARVGFHVRTGSSTLTGVIEMPVYNTNKTDQLQVRKQEQPAYVSVSGATPLEIHLDNLGEALPVVVTEAAVTEDCPKCWTKISSGVSDNSPLQLGSGAGADLPMTLSPNTLPALLRGALVLKPDMPHDTLSITLTYHSIPGGADKKQTIPAKVRFGPGVFGLALALCSGLALGLAARYLLTGRLGSDNERALHAILTALVLGLIAEFVGILLTAYGDSRLILLGLDIDPSQLFPAFILAILVSGGTAVVSWIKDLFGRAK